MANFQVDFGKAKEPLKLKAGEAHVIKVLGAKRIRLSGMFFDLDKCFLLPTAMRGIRKLKEVYEQNPAAKLLVVGHTDTSGEDAKNLTLSLERADAVAAYLTDKVAAWEAFFNHQDAKKKWGFREIQLMLSELPEGKPRFFTGPPTGVEDAATKKAVTEFQSDQGLKKVDGIAGEDTRKALIKAYMSLDKTTLPAGIELTTHGCGENFPEDEVKALPPGEKKMPPKQANPGARNPKDRRVEIYLFDGAIDPPPPGKTSKRDSGAYLEWRSKALTTIDFNQDGDEFVPPDNLTLRLHDDTAEPITAAAFRVTIDGNVQGPLEADDTGTAVITLPPVCPEQILLEWGLPGTTADFPFVQEIFASCQTGTEEQQLIAKLHNLGFTREFPLDLAVRGFQEEFGVDNVPESAGLGPDGKLPPATRARLDRIYNEDELLGKP